MRIPARLVACGALLLSACGGGNEDVVNTLVDVRPEPAGSNCIAGGLKSSSGIDRNGNATLDPEEVNHTAYVCNGSNGSDGVAGLGTLVDVKAEPAGSNCPLGGTRIASGIDVDRDGVLAAAEATSTQYVCGSGRSDVVPPEIAASAPAVASTANTQFDVVFSDDVELAYVGVPSGSQATQFMFLPEGVNTHRMTDTLPVRLGSSSTKTLLAVDTSGNVAKKTITVSPPPTAIALGNYVPTATVTLPAGFDCTNWPPRVVVDRVSLTDEQISGTGGSFWSVEQGYQPVVSVYLTGWRATRLLDAGLLANYVPRRVPLAATSFGGGEIDLFPSISAKVSVSQVAGSPETLDVTVRMFCGASSMGPPLSFQARLAR